MSVRGFAPWLRHAGRLLQGRLPGQLVIQLTERCNARCPQCGMNVGQRYARATLAENAARRLLERASMNGVAAVSFTGGEPLLDFEMLRRLIHYAGALGIRLTRTGTNAFFLARPWAADFDARAARIVEGLAATPLRNLWISLDSADAATHEQLRGFPGVVAGIAKALPRFHAAGIYPAANLGLNRYAGGARPVKGNEQDADALIDNWRRALETFLRRAIELGFTAVNFCYPMSVAAAKDADELQPVYAASATAELVNFKRIERQAILQALLEIIPRFRRQIRIFTPRSSLQVLLRQGSAASPCLPYGCLGGRDFFFVAARTGHLFPCGFRGHEDLGSATSGAWPAQKDAVCSRCDWECFRDPSTLAGPVLQAMNHPLAAARTLWRDKQWRALWCSDLSYYHACGWFDGRRTP